ncbi:MAG: penicillin-binding protein activator LpoB [Candidatus Omnitrophota bacterium]|nr:penicillin-binding protein activator LpoB [Candidatus Omnitrophota bacterium]
MKLKFVMLSILSVVFFAVGCASTKVERVDVKEKIDLSGDWNDTDAQIVAQELISNSLAGSWLIQYNQQTNRQPTVIVGHIENRSSEHIDPQVIVKQIEQELLNSGKVRFVASPDERKQVRGERKEQHKGWTDPETIKKIGKELGADYMMAGSINAVNDESKGRRVVFYQVNLELVDLETNQKVWIGQSELKKTVSKSALSF